MANLVASLLKKEGYLMFMVLLSGALALFLGTGIARFAFTPLLPFMQSDYGFSDTVSGALASANYVGYLLGAFYVRKLSGVGKTYAWFLFSVIMTIVCIGLMAIGFYPIWFLFRFWSGFFSGLLLVLSSEFILFYLIRVQKTPLFGMIYSGIGMGMMVSGLIVPLLYGPFGSSQIWIWLAGLSVLPAIVVIIYLPKPDGPFVKDSVKRTTVRDPRLISLYVAYLLEGFGYIVTGTFISVIVLRGTESVALAGYVWTIAGLAAIFITPVWSLLSKRYGVVQMLGLIYLIQSVSIAAPVLFPSTLAAVCGAIGYGGTFLGIVSMALVYGKQLNPTGNTTAVLTIFFSLGQAIGPLVAGTMAELAGGFDLPVLLAAFTVLTGGILILINKGEKHAIH